MSWSKLTSGLVLTGVASLSHPTAFAMKFTLFWAGL